MVGLREQRQQEVRGALERAAWELFDQHGYDDTTVDMVAVAVEVSPRTFHRYFDTKAGVVFEPCRRLIDRVVGRAAPGLSALELIDVIVGEVEHGLRTDELGRSLQLLRQHPDLIDESAVWRRRWAEDVARALAAAEGRGSPSLVDRARSTTAIHIGALAGDEWILRRPTESFRQLAAEVTEAVCDALGHPG